MKAQVFSLPEFSVIGAAGQGPTKFAQWWIRPLWKRFDEEFDSIRHLVKRDSFGALSGVWGLTSDAHSYLAPWGEEGRYLAGCEANVGVSPPKGFSIWSVPAQTYLVAQCDKDAYEDVYRRTISELMTGGRYRMTGALFERYPAGLDAAGSVWLYFPVERLSVDVRG